MNTADALISELEDFIEKIKALSFSGKAAAVYNPLIYAGEPYRNYVKEYGASGKKVLFLGMNPGPWGMAQTGIPFGEIESVHNWLGITGKIGHPEVQHVKRPVTGWDCKRSEVSGRRLWGLIKDRFITPELFFKNHFVENYCPLVFMEESGRNITPDKLVKEEREPLFDICDSHLKKVIRIFSPEYLVGIGKFAEKRLTRVVSGMGRNRFQAVTSIIHPSPANPQANKDWKGNVVKKLTELGIWET